MSKIGELWRKTLFLLRRRQMERELAEEMRDHLERKAAKNSLAGMSDEEAGYAARRQLGNLALQQERSRANWGFTTLESLVQDIRYGLRGLRQSPGFSTVAVLTLALGIGSSTAIFSIVNAILFRPLPFPDSERVVHLWTASPQFPDLPIGVSKPDFDDIQSQAQSFEIMAFFEDRVLSLSNPGEAEQVIGAYTTTNILSVFGVSPQLGHDFQADDEKPGNRNVALISYGLLQRKFAGDPGVLGRKLTLDQEVYTVIGVLPRGFEFPDPLMRAVEILIPLNLGGNNMGNRGSRFLPVYAKLKPGAKLEKTQVELDAISERLSRQYPKEDSGIKLHAVQLREEVIKDARAKLLVLLAAVGFLLMIACSNVGNVILSRGVQRHREIAVRAALGASRGRIVRQLFIESLLLTCFGGAAGVLVAVWGMDAFKLFAPKDLPRLTELHVEPAIAWFALAISSLAAIVCGLAPAFEASRPDLVFALKDRTGASAAGTSRRFSLRSFLVVSEVALALVLVTGAALLAQTLVRILKVDPGFRTDHLLSADLDLAAPRYTSEAGRLTFTRQMLDELHSRPELSRAAMTNASAFGDELMVVFDPATLGLAEKPAALENKAVDPAYFEVLGIPLHSGRVFTDRDTATTTTVAIVNEAFARHYFPGQSPLGKNLSFGPKRQLLIVGVVADTRDIDLRQKPGPQLYTTLLQSPSHSPTVYIRTSADDPVQLANALRRSVAMVGNDVRVTHVQTMAAAISQSVAEDRFRAWLLSVFAAAGLTLALIGIYGVISYSVNQRTREMGIRIALGAQAGDVLRLVMGQGVRLALLGAAIGVAGSLGLMRLLLSLLYNTKPGDPLTLAGAALAMLSVAVCASYLPARRATKVDPMVALRNE